MSERRHRLEELVDMMQVWDQLEPEGDFGSTVVVSDTGLEANVEIQLLLGGVFRPSHFLEAIRLCVDKLGILRNWLVWITEKCERRIYLLLTSNCNLKENNTKRNKEIKHI